MSPMVANEITCCLRPSRLSANSPETGLALLVAVAVVFGGAGPQAAVLAVAPQSTDHWAYQRPGRPAIPRTRPGDDIRTPIDAFIVRRLRQQGFVPLGAAARVTLIRRVTLDLLGIPPTPEEIDAFLADRTAGSWERLVDRLLASPRYGERWAVPWLDAGRFADSNGYQRDGRREAWAWRDWVIDALNSDLPFDRFTIEQLAGDLLPAATVSSRVATGFHRGTMANVEAGVDPEEERVLAVIDRVNTTAAVWLGTTIECAQCHDHKYDPFTQREYYSLFAFFNSTQAEIRTAGTRRDFTGPKIQLPQAVDTLDRARAQQRRVQRLAVRQAALRGVLDREQSAWEVLVGNRDDTPGWLKKILSTRSGRRTARQKGRVGTHYRSLSREWTGLVADLKKARTLQKTLAPATTLVMSELSAPRVTRLLKRGNFLDPGDPVLPGTPAAWPLLPVPTGRGLNRLDLARWLVDGNHPLTARVVVNRHWAKFFGRGLVSTIEDFGARGAEPTHPQLLDWLATEWVRQEWSLKSLHRLFVLSSVYRRRAAAPQRLRLADPDNRWYARAARRRLPAELIRDNALAIAGLLSDKMHGLPVFPRQPKGVWNHIGVASNLWKTSQGEDLYRRGVYVYWRRTVPYPSFVNFDAPTREVCSVARSHSNTPLQALTLLNDPVFFEAAGALALRVNREAGERATAIDRVEQMFRRATGRRPLSGESKILVDRYREEYERLVGEPRLARSLVETWIPRAVSEDRAAGDGRIALAAWLHVANVILNLDEVITRE